MKLTNHVHLVGSGSSGFNLTHRLDCHVYVVDGGSEAAMIDAGIGLATKEILANVDADGIDRQKITKLLVTHPHADHAGGLAEMQAALSCEVLVADEAAEWVREADEAAISLDFAREVGFYPEDYRWRPCEVDTELADGEGIEVGDLCFRVLATPGHSRGHLAFAFEADGMSHLLSGDSVFWGGQILLQNIWDCVLEEYAETIRRLAALDVDVFLPGHRCFSLKDGQRHLNKAAEYTNRLGVPPNLI